VTSPSFAQLAGLSAWVAAVMTVVGMVTLMLFFSRGGRWGWWNDVASVILMLALIPVALVLAVIELEVVTTTAIVVAIIGIGAMLTVAVLQALLVARRVTYEQTKVAVLGFGAVVGVWYLLTAVVSANTAIPDGIRLASAAAGVGFIAVGYGFARGGERDPIAATGGIVLFVASLVFQVWLGYELTSGRLVVPEWNV
jgi:hypothetical protein